MSTIGEHYENVADLGVGGYSRVKLSVDTRTNTYVAIKILLSEQKKTSSNETKWIITDSKVKQCKREIRLMQKIAHRNVVALHDVIEDATFPQKDENGKMVETPCLCVVLEYCSRGELFDFLMYTGRLGERASRTYFIQFLDGLKAMHDSGYAHRDLKPENLLLSQDFTLKIADFGFATQFKDQRGKIKMATTCGTRGYLAPELLAGHKYTHKVDLFAVGIIMFTTFAGFPPFQHAGAGDWWWDKMSKAWTYWNDSGKLATDSEQKERYKKGTEKMKLFWAAHERSLPFDNKFKDLMENLLNPYPDQRFDITDCLKHAWMKGKTYSDKQIKKYMKKFVNTVNAQRAIKIEKQLKDQNMDSQKDNNAKRILLDHAQLEQFEKLTEQFEKQLSHIDENTALLNSTRFKFESTKALLDILVPLDVVSRKTGAHIDMNVEKCQLRIDASVTRPTANGQGTFVEDVKVMCKVFRAQFETFDSEEDGYMNDINEDIAEDDDSNDNNMDTDSDSKESDDSGVNTVRKAPQTDNKRFAVLFYRIEGSADGFQQIMASIFYHPILTQVMDFKRFLPKTDAARTALEKRNETARAFVDVFNQNLPSEVPQIDFI